MRLRTLMLMLALVAGPLHAETATTLRAVELKKEPFADAETLASLAAQATVDIVRRQGGWTQIKTGERQGWVKMLSLRPGAADAAKPAGDSGIGALLSAARTGSSGVTAATGVRGLDAESLKNAQPNPDELERLRRLAASDADARAFAAEGKLASRPFDYLAPGKAETGSAPAGWGN